MSMIKTCVPNFGLSNCKNVVEDTMWEREKWIGGISSFEDVLEKCNILLGQSIMGEFIHDCMESDTVDEWWTVLYPPQTKCASEEVHGAIRHAKSEVTFQQLKDIIDSSDGVYGLVHGKCSEQFYADLNERVSFDTENCEYIGSFDMDGATMSQFERINGVSVVWCCAGGDWENPIAFAIYMDEDDNIRAYVPQYGNAYNHDFQCAYGSEPSNISEEDSEKYERMRDSDKFNANQMRMDIASTITIRGVDPIPYNPNGNAVVEESLVVEESIDDCDLDTNYDDESNQCIKKFESEEEENSTVSNEIVRQKDNVDDDELTMMIDDIMLRFMDDDILCIFKDETIANDIKDENLKLEEVYKNASYYMWGSATKTFTIDPNGDNPKECYVYVGVDNKVHAYIPKEGNGLEKDYNAMDSEFEEKVVRF